MSLYPVFPTRKHVDILLSLLGPRACIGRKFATTEAVCFLTMLLRDWKVEPALKPNETKQAWQERILDARLVLTLGVADVPVRFIRRQ